MNPNSIFFILFFPRNFVVSYRKSYNIYKLLHFFSRFFISSLWEIIRWLLLQWEKKKSIEEGNLRLAKRNRKNRGDYEIYYSFGLSSSAQFQSKRISFNNDTTSFEESPGQNIFLLDTNYWILKKWNIFWIDLELIVKFCFRLINLLSIRSLCAWSFYNLSYVFISSCEKYKTL